MSAGEGFRGVPGAGLLALAYGQAIRLRNRFYDRPGMARNAPVPVVSVGNLTVGGTGKTPLAIWLARRLRAVGRSPAIVSRGYRGTAGRGPLLVSDGSGPRVRWERCGDEPFLAARLAPGVRVVVGSDRCSGAGMAFEAGADVVILDDGFQHRRLGRDLDVVVLDGECPFGNGRLLPAGPLREPLSALSRAQVVVASRTPAGSAVPEVARALERYNPQAALVRTGIRRVGFVDRDGFEVARPSRAVAFCGIGNPESFRRELLAHGVELAEFEAFPDHHRYGEKDLRSLTRRASGRDATLVTTEKDLVRLSDATPSTAGALIALRIETQVHDETALLEAVAAALRRGEERA